MNRILLSLLLAFSTTPVYQVQAADLVYGNASCDCVIPASDSTNPLGSVVDANGSVRVGSPENFSQAQIGQGIFSGDDIEVGPVSSAAVDLGVNCPRLELGPETYTTIRPIDASQQSFGLVYSSKFGADLLPEPELCVHIEETKRALWPWLLVPVVACAAFCRDGGDTSD